MISGQTRLFGVLGDPVRHSKSPAMQSAALEAAGIDGVMLAFEADEETFPDVARSLATLGAIGFNVTMPCKGAAYRFCDTLSDEARMTGSVNTVKIEDGRFHGHSTDGSGFFRHLKENGVSADGGKLVILGAGGAAASIAAAGLSRCDEVVIVNRTVEKAEALKKRIAEVNEELARKLTVAGREELAGVLKDADVLVNATNLGMAPREDSTPLEEVEWIPSDCTVVDIVYNPETTRFMRECGERGLTVLGGLGMLLGQGADAFEIFTGHPFPMQAAKEAIF